jgi:hypothetical protein
MGKKTKEKMVKVIYEGPQSGVNVHPYGKHQKSMEKEYPESFAKELINTSLKQQFKIVGSAPNPPDPDKDQKGKK